MAKVAQSQSINIMQWFSFCILLFALLGVLQASPAGHITIRTSSRKHVSVRGNANIKWNGDCHNCDIRAGKNSASVTSVNSRTITRKF